MTPVKPRITPWRTTGVVAWFVVVPFRGNFVAWRFRDAVQFAVQMYEVAALEQMFALPDLRSEALITQ